MTYSVDQKTNTGHRKAVALIGVLLAIALLVTPIRARLNAEQESAPLAEMYTSQYISSTVEPRRP